MNIDYNIIGRRIKELRNSKRISQMVLAEKCDICDSYLSYIECGRRIPSLTLLLKIAEVLDAPIDSLLKDSTETVFDTYDIEINELIGDCTLYEKKVICETILSLKESIRQNKSLIIHEVKSSIKD